MKRMHSLLVWMAALSATLFCTAVLAQSTPSAEPRVALSGYDPVAYFTEQRPVMGKPEYRKDWDGARYYFASPKNRDAFSADPDRYAPQFSGFCSGSVSNGNRAEGDPTAWKIVDGRLYVWGNAEGKEKADKDPSLLLRAHAKWKERK